jgi:hypothetical protein
MKVLLWSPIPGVGFNALKISLLCWGVYGIGYIIWMLIKKGMKK